MVFNPDTLKPTKEVIFCRNPHSPKHSDLYFNSLVVEKWKQSKTKQTNKQTKKKDSNKTKDWILALIWVGFLGITFVVGKGGRGKTSPCLKLDKITLKTWN